jgi:hypothetical protein
VRYLGEYNNNSGCGDGRDKDHRHLSPDIGIHEELLYNIKLHIFFTNFIV